MPKSVSVVNGKNNLKSYYSSYNNYNCYSSNRINKSLKSGTNKRNQAKEHWYYMQSKRVYSYSSCNDFESFYMLQNQTKTSGRKIFKMLSRERKQYLN